MLGFRTGKNYQVKCLSFNGSSRYFRLLRCMVYKIKLIYKDGERMYFDKSQVPRPYNRQVLQCAGVICEMNGCMIDTKVPEDAWFPVARYKEALLQRIRRIDCEEMQGELIEYCKRKEGR